METRSAASYIVARKAPSITKVGFFTRLGACVGVIVLALFLGLLGALSIGCQPMDGEPAPVEVMEPGTPEEAVPYITCPLGTPYLVTVWLRVAAVRTGLWIDTCDTNLQVRVDGEPAPLYTCVQSENHDYTAIYQVTVLNTAWYHDIDVWATDGRKVSVGQQFLVTSQECLWGETWRHVTVQYLP